MNGDLNNPAQCAAELSRELMVHARLDGTLLEVNSAWSHLLGWDEVELKGKSFFDLLHPDDVARTQEQVARGAAGLTPLAFDSRYRHKDGSYRRISWLAVAHANDLYATGRDITAEAEAMAALHEAQETVRHLQKMDSIGQLAGGIAHEFNNSLQSIVAALELVRKLIGAGRTGETERFIASAIAAAHRAAALNQRVLGFSRRQPLTLKPLIINEVIVGMGDVLLRSLPRSIKLDLKLAADLWQTHCDANQAEGALLNIILNARDAMPDGGSLMIESSNASASDGAGKPAGVAPGQYVRIAVTDSGTGMEQEVIARAFDAFFTTKADALGVGLGLTLVDRFARQNGGSVEIQSAVGRGTCVALYLPRHQTE